MKASNIVVKICSSQNSGVRGTPKQHTSVQVNCHATSMNPLSNVKQKFVNRQDTITMSQWMEVQYNTGDDDKLTQVRRCLQFLKSEAKAIRQLVEQSWPMGLSRRTEDRWSEIPLLRSPFVPSFRNLHLMSFAE